MFFIFCRIFQVYFIRGAVFFAVKIYFVKSHVPQKTNYFKKQYKDKDLKENAA